MYFYVYKIICKPNKKIYIGKHQTEKLNDSYFAGGYLIKKALKKYGKENFEREIIEFCQSEIEVCEREKYWIKFYNSCYPIGYNITEGGEGKSWFNNHPEKEKIQQHMSESHKGKIPWNKGKKMSQEYKEKCKNRGMPIAGWNKNLAMSDDFREKCKLRQVGKIPWNKGKKGLQIPWNKGKTGFTSPRKGKKINKKWFTNGQKSILLSLTEIPPEGFYPGRVIKNKL